MRPHPEAHPDVAGYLLGALEPEEAQEFADHLATCAACRDEVAALSALPGLLSDLPPIVAPPPDLEARTFARIAEEAAVGAAIVPLASRRRPPRWRMLTAAAAAVIVLAVGIGVATSLRHSQPAPIATIQLIAADGGPAHATATIRPSAGGLSIDMTVTDLAPSPPGTMYTCWLVSRDDSQSRPDRVSVGSFVVRSPRTTVKVHWTTSADLTHFSQLGITTEPSNGNPAHQGPKVLVGR